ncbi:MAG: ABC transporter substrate binding protein [Desulfuromusa sp.]|nr:ABC transporter substrate binding protein [Desulfuromusa sp.]
MQTSYHHVINSIIFGMLQFARHLIGNLPSLPRHFFFYLTLILFSSPAWAGENISILYPEVSAPYNTIFEKIIAGIASEEKLNIHPMPIKNGEAQSQLKKQLLKTNCNAIIALGKRASITAEKLQSGLPTVFGALPYIPDGRAGISLSADPQQQFKTLKSIAPKITTLSVVFSPKTNSWMIPLAEAAAKQQGLKLMTFPAKNLREAMLHYRKILRTANSNTDAIWLPLDSISADDKVVLPMLLREAWDKDLVILSSKPTDVQRGVLFSMYPDNYGMGQELANLLLLHLEGKADPLISPVKKLLLAVNLRTAAHLGLNFTPQQQRNFDLTFPSR